MQFAKGHPQLNTGRTHIKKGQRLSPATEFKKGHKESDEEKIKRGWAISIAIMSNPALRKKRSDRMKGKKCNFWAGGKSKEPYPEEWTNYLKENIRMRDDYLCIICSKHGNTVHHIDYNKQNCKEDNLIALCRSCHAKTNFNRYFWQYWLNTLYSEVIEENGKKNIYK